MTICEEMKTQTMGMILKISVTMMIQVSSF